jgi:hypothetical protein
VKGGSDSNEEISLKDCHLLTAIDRLFLQILDGGLEGFLPSPLKKRFFLRRRRRRDKYAKVVVRWQGFSSYCGVLPLRFVSMDQR